MAGTSRARGVFIRRRRWWPVVLVAVCWLSLAGAAQAATIDVTRLDDPLGPGTCPSDCSLRQAIAFSASGDTIQLSATPGSPYALSQGNALLVTHSLTIDGAGRAATRIDGSLNRDIQGRPDRILKATGGTLEITDMTFTGGTDGRDENFTSCSPCQTITANGGGALFNAGATVTLEAVGFDSNSGSPVGGAIGNAGTLNLTDVDFRANGAAFGSGLFSRSGLVTANRVTFRDAIGGSSGGAAYLRGGTMTLTNSTAVGNGWAASIGGGIVNQAGNLTLLNVTLAGNIRGGLQTDQAGTTTVRNTILGTGYFDGEHGSCVAAGKSTAAGSTTARAVTTDLGNNIDQDGTCALTGPNDQSLVDPRLAPATDNGGSTPTAALLHGSPAIDAGNDAACPLIDQRGVTRSPQGAHCDIGAFEAVTLGPPSVTVTSAREIGSTDVTLAATINLAGEAGALHFRWGTSPASLTDTTLVVAAGVLSSPTERTVALQGLSPGRTYYFQAVAENASGSVPGGVQQFTTQTAPPMVTEVSVTSVTDTTATIAFSIDPAGADTHYVIEYENDAGHGETASVGIGSAAGRQQLSRTLTGLQPGSEYSIDVVATNDLGTVGADAGPQGFTTAPQLTEDAGSPVTLSDIGNASDCPTASIDWGDGTPADRSGTVTCTDDNHDGYDYELTATHTYATAGHFHIRIAYSTDDRSDQWALISPAPEQEQPTPDPDPDPDPIVTPPLDAVSVQPEPTATPAPAPTPTATPTPTFNETVVVPAVSGTVLVKLKGSKTFVVLSAGQSVPFGSQIDATKGRITLTSVSERGGPPQTATFYDGIFTITQRGAITELTLSGPAPTCGSKGKANAAAGKVKSRRLWGDGKGKFRTRGQYSAATVRGTKWLVEDSCAGTLTRVVTGVVSVNDLVLRRTIIVRAGKRYLARPRRR